jgi:hypothetical protein
VALPRAAEQLEVVEGVRLEHPVAVVDHLDDVHALKGVLDDADRDPVGLRVECVPHELRDPGQPSNRAGELLEMVGLDRYFNACHGCRCSHTRQAEQDRLSRAQREPSRTQSRDATHVARLLSAPGPSSPSWPPPDRR